MENSPVHETAAEERRAMLRKWSEVTGLPLDDDPTPHIPEAALRISACKGYYEVKKYDDGQVVAKIHASAIAALVQK